MNEFNKALDALYASGLAPMLFLLTFVTVFFLMFLHLRARSRREQERNKVDHPKMWLEACRRIQGAVDEHQSGRLKVGITNDEPYGGHIRVMWQFGTGRSERVLSLRYLPEQPDDKIVVMMHSSKGRAFDSFSLEQFPDFLGDLEERILKYESPLSEGGDKSIKL
ncbi:MAG: hypothetical protein RLY47_384 [Candidatus Parcubacteria bacterium]|jgi:hypothetical protein